MEDQRIFDMLHQAESQMLELSNTLANVKKELADLIEENNQLRMTNHDLHDMVLRQNQSQINVETQDDESQTAISGTGSSRLQTYYDEGIHVCHQYFGAHRHLDEECILCLGVLDEISNKQPGQ